MIRNIAILLTLLANVSLLAQHQVPIVNPVATVEARGLAISKLTNEVIGGAVVTIVNHTHRYETKVLAKDNGNFTLTLQPNNDYTIYATSHEMASLPYALNTGTVKVSNDMVTKLIILQLSNTTPKPSSNLLSITKGYRYSHVDEHLSLNNTPPATNVSYNSINFRIHIGLYSRPLGKNSRFLAPLQNRVKQLSTSEGILYYIDGFADYKSAETYQEELQTQQYHNTEIVVYSNDIPIDMSPEQAIFYIKQKRYQEQN